MSSVPENDRISEDDRAPATGGGVVADAPTGDHDASEIIEGSEMADETEVTEATEAELASEIESEITELAAERDQYRDIAQRIQADFENYRKRVQQQVRDEADRASAKLASALLPVLDATEAAYLRHPDEVGPLLNLLLSELKKQGLETVNLQDQPFDPNVAEAVAHEPRDGGDVVVAEVLRSGYTWHGRTLRPAMVRTATEGATMAAQREWFEKDYYQELGVAGTATPKEITKAYRKLARELHPDKNPNNAQAEERFKAVSAAYDVLGDETKRAEYDEVRRLGPMGGRGGPGGPGGFTFNMDDAADSGLGDLLGQMFGRRTNRGGASAAAGPRRGGDIDAELTLDFVDAAHGMTTTLHLTSDAQCTTCHGSGARPGTTPKLCPQCGGRGVVDDNQGMFSFSSPCRRCAGAGTVIEDPCPTCTGSGVERRPREVQARIPAGVSDGQTIRLKGRGAPGRNGGPAGDLLVKLHVAPHARFGRTGNDLTTRIPVSFSDAALGGEVAVPTLDGPAVKLRIKPGTQPGSRHRVRGKGIETTKSTGDLIVTVDIVVPTSLSDAERSAIEQLAAASAGATAEASS